MRWVQGVDVNLREMINADKEKWLKTRLEQVQDAIDGGDYKPWWELLNGLFGKAARQQEGPR